ncbi:MAG: hypothetical protein ACI3W5_07480 [Faecousia sp.]
MGKLRKKTIVAGPLVYETIYPLPNPKDSRAVRNGKKNLTSSAQQRMNFKYQWQKLEILMAANFRVGDIVLTLTFDNSNLPDSRAQTMNRVKQFLKKLRELRKPFGHETKYIYVVEHKHCREDPCFTPVEQAQQGRYHVHMILNATGQDFDNIKKCWSFGLTEMHLFELNRDRTYESLAKYFCKELPDYVGARKFIPSRGLIRPEPDCQIVDSSETLEPPKGATVYDDPGKVRTVYGCYQFIKYLWPKLVEKAPRKRKNKHRRIRSGKRI